MAIQEIIIDGLLIVAGYLGRWIYDKYDRKKRDKKEMVKALQSDARDLCCMAVEYYTTDHDSRGRNCRLALLSAGFRRLGVDLRIAIKKGHIRDEEEIVEAYKDFRVASTRDDLEEQDYPVDASHSHVRSVEDAEAVFRDLLS